MYEKKVLKIIEDLHRKEKSKSRHKGFIILNRQTSRRISCKEFKSLWNDPKLFDNYVFMEPITITGDCALELKYKLL